MGGLVRVMEEEQDHWKLKLWVWSSWEGMVAGGMWKDIPIIKGFSVPEM